MLGVHARTHARRRRRREEDRDPWEGSSVACSNRSAGEDTLGFFAAPDPRERFTSARKDKPNAAGIALTELQLLNPNNTLNCK
jgi:hypothetical protein